VLSPGVPEDFNLDRNAVRIVLGAVTNASVHSNMDIAALSVADWQDTAANDTITAPWVGAIVARAIRGATGLFQRADRLPSASTMRRCPSPQPTYSEFKLIVRHA
jgi:hypothetical protein